MSKRNIVRIALFSGLLVGSGGVARAQQLERGPYLQSGSDTQVIVCWRTDVPTNSRVKYGLSPTNLNLQVNDSASVADHAVTLAGLTPNTTWYYSVGSSTKVLAGGDAQHFLVTAPPKGRMKATRIWVIGDAGTKDASQRAVRDAFYGFAGARHTDFWCMLGDNAYNSGRDDEYQQAVFENMYEARLIDSVLWPAYGNHDATSADSDTQSGVYYDIFELPRNGQCGGVPSGTEAYYSFDWSNAHFVCLDSMESNRQIGGPMLTWLEQDLAANTREWLIAFWHHPPYSKGSHDSDNDVELIEMRNNAVVTLEKWGVDLVLAGHSHSYERSFLIDGHYGKSASFDPQLHGKDMGDGRLDGDGAYKKPGAATSPHEGAVYSVCGSSGKTENGPLNHNAMYVGLLSLGSLVLDLNGAQLEARFIDDHGNVLDHFTLVKGNATPVQVAQHQSIGRNAVWKYNDTGSDLGTSWRNLGYSDAGWKQGPGILGYGESYINTTLSYGGNPNDKYITTYFRKSFDFQGDPTSVTRLAFDSNFDDGFVAYLNGVEVTRQAMPGGTINYKSLATGHEGGSYQSIDVTPFADLLIQGVNVLALEVHQSNKTSTDLVWDLDLVYDGFAPYLSSAATGAVNPIGGIPLDVLRVNGSTGGLGRSVDMASHSPLEIAIDNPPTHSNAANFVLFAWVGTPTEADRFPLGSMGDLCFAPVIWLANNLPVGPPGYLASTPAPWVYTAPFVDGPLDFCLQGIIEETEGKLRTTNAVLVHVQ